MNFLSDDTTPWHLIGSALQGNLSPEEDMAFQQWLASGEENRELFMRLKEVWHNELDDYPVYRQADETVGWNALHTKLAKQPQTFTYPAKRRARLITMVSIAAILIIAIGLVTWYGLVNGSSYYSTGHTEQRSVSLADGTIIKLYASTRIEVPADYNQSSRTIILKNGEAFFEVRHKEEMPFVVDLGTASIKDIGTGFTVKKANDSIYVSVVTGKVEFREHARNQVHLLSAGMHLGYYSKPGITQPIIIVDSADVINANRLRFVNTALPEVIGTFKEVYKKQIIIFDTAIAHKRFTGHLDGESFEGAMDVLCKSLNLTFVKENDVYYLKKE